MLGFVLALVTISLMTAVLFLLPDGLNTSTVVLLYLVPVLVSTAMRGLWPGVFSAFAAFLAYNYFSQLVGRAHAGLAAAVARESETTRLYELSLDLTGANILMKLRPLR